MNINELNIYENLTNMLYYFVDIKILRKILSTNTFRLKTNISTNIDNKNIYYIPFSNSKLGIYHHSILKYNLGTSILVINHNKLIKDGYKNKVIKYREPKIKNEIENKVYANKPFINDASKYIMEIHLYFKQTNNNKELDEFNFRTVRQLVRRSKNFNIPIFVYKNKEDMILLNKQKSIKNILKLKPSSKIKHTTFYSSQSPFSELIELLNVSNKENLSKSARKKLYNMKWRLKNNDVENISYEINSAQKNYQRSIVSPLLNKMKELHINSSKELVKFIINKFK